MSLGTQIYHPNIEVEIDFDVLSEHASTSRADLVRQLKVLDTKSFGSLAEPDEYEPAMALVGGSTAYMGWEFFQALNLLGEYGIADDEREAIIRSVIVDLDFTALDAE